jgi:acyl dehydratase
MTSETETLFPRSLVVDIRLDVDPRYKGSIHDDAVARARGYKAALVPGAFVYGHMGRVAVEAWGLVWLERGGMGASFRRPVYNGDRLTISASALSGDADMRRSAVIVTNGDGEEVASGWIGLPDLPPPLPDLLAFVALPRLDTPPSVAIGRLKPGTPLTTAGRVLTEEDFRRSLSAFEERHPLHARDGVVHPGCLMRLAMGDTHNSFRPPSAVVLTGVEAQHFGTVRPGERLTTVGTIADIWVRNGKHYFQSEEFLRAEGRLVARFLRTQIYGYENT